MKLKWSSARRRTAETKRLQATKAERGYCRRLALVLKRASRAVCAWRACDGLLLIALFARDRGDESRISQLLSFTGETPNQMPLPLHEPINTAHHTAVRSFQRSTAAVCPGP